MAGKGGKGRKLGSTIPHGHPWMLLRYVVRQVYNIGVIFHKDVEGV